MFSIRKKDGLSLVSVLVTLGIVTIAFTILSQTIFQNLNVTTKVRGRDAVSQIEDAVRDWISIRVGDFLERPTRCADNVRTTINWQPASGYASDQFQIANIGNGKTWDEEPNETPEYAAARTRCSAEQTGVVSGATKNIYLCFALYTPGPTGVWPQPGSVLPKNGEPPVYIEMSYFLWNFDQASNQNCSTLYGQPDDPIYGRGGNVVYTVYYRSKKPGSSDYNFHARAGTFFVKSHD